MFVIATRYSVAIAGGAFCHNRFELDKSVDKQVEFIDARKL
ncbi:MAG: hypothetical protein WBA07_07745 [Rivularia sp. (in: cyanobacteria)]